MVASTLGMHSWCTVHHLFFFTFIHIWISYWISTWIIMRFGSSIENGYFLWVMSDFNLGHPWDPHLTVKLFFSVLWHKLHVWTGDILVVSLLVARAWSFPSRISMRCQCAASLFRLHSRWRLIHLIRIHCHFGVALPFRMNTLWAASTVYTTYFLWLLRCNTKFEFGFAIRRATSRLLWGSHSEAILTILDRCFLDDTILVSYD